MKIPDRITVIGLTGQTGAGKSTVSGVFRENGFAVIDADGVSRSVTKKGTECLEKLSETFGDVIMNADGTLNRKALAGIVFTDRGELEKLNKIIYPYITEKIVGIIKKFSEAGERFVLLDAPTLFESGSDSLCRVIVSVTADFSVRKERIIERDGLSEKQAENRMNSQLSEDFFRENSDFVIENNGTPDELRLSAEGVVTEIKRSY